MSKKATSKGSGRGFASMTKEKQKGIARIGGESVPPEKRSFSQNRELASEAGKKGGKNMLGKDRSFFRNRELASEAGRKGGLVRSAKAKLKGEVP
jgi:general stress protein YciG